MRRKKGQTLVFEQVLLFTIGIAIFIASFALFSMYQSSYLSVMRWDQLKAVKEYTVSNIIEVSKKHEFESTVLLEIPKRIGNDYYRLTMSPNGLNISFLTGNERDYDSSSLYGLNSSYNLSGSVTSDRGKVIIYKKGNSITLQ